MTEGERMCSGNPGSTDKCSYAFDPVRLAGALYALYDKGAQIDRIVAMLDEFEAHHPPPVVGEG
jgi:hypothetical protein